MNAYEKLLGVMGAGAEPSRVTLATMESATSCRVGKLKLQDEDLLIAHHLKTGWRIDDYTFINPLQAGDQVLIVKISDELYAVMERVV